MSRRFLLPPYQLKVIFILFFLDKIFLLVHHKLKTFKEKKKGGECTIVLLFILKTKQQKKNNSFLITASYGVRRRTKERSGHWFRKREDYKGYLKKNEKDTEPVIRIRKLTFIQNC